MAKIAHIQPIKVEAPNSGHFNSAREALLKNPKMVLPVSHHTTVTTARNACRRINRGQSAKYSPDIYFAAAVPNQEPTEQVPGDWLCVVGLREEMDNLGFADWVKRNTEGRSKPVEEHDSQDQDQVEAA